MTTPELKTNIRLHMHIESAHNEWLVTKYLIIKCTHEILTPSVTLMSGHKIDTWQLCRASPAGFITLSMSYSHKTHTPGLIISPASFIILIMPYGCKTRPPRH